jgi:hypothetical protein
LTLSGQFCLAVCDRYFSISEFKSPETLFEFAETGSNVHKFVTRLDNENARCFSAGAARIGPVATDIALQANVGFRDEADLNGTCPK